VKIRLIKVGKHTYLPTYYNVKVYSNLFHKNGPYPGVLSDRGERGRPFPFRRRRIIFKSMLHARRAISNHGRKVSFSRWRERVRVRVERSGFPLTSFLSHGGERRYLLGYFPVDESLGKRRKRKWS
jgi:hypothetical protein